MLLVLSEDHKEHLSFLTKVDGCVVEEFGRIALEFLKKGTNPKVYEGAARKLGVPVGMVQRGVEGLMFLMTESSKHMLVAGDAYTKPESDAAGGFFLLIGSHSSALSLCATSGRQIAVKDNNYFNQRGAQDTADEENVASDHKEKNKRNVFEKNKRSAQGQGYKTALISEVDFMDSVLALGFGEALIQSLLQLYLQHKHQIRSILSQLTYHQPAYHNLEWRLDVQLASRSVHQQIVPMVTMRLHLSRCYGAGSTHSFMDLQTDPSTLLHVISTLEAALTAMKTSHARRILRNIK